MAFAQYLISLKANKNLPIDDQEKLITVFRLYNQLSLSSDTPDGFEEELPFSVDGRLYVWRQGVLEPVDNNKDLSEALKGIDRSIFADNKPDEALSQQLPNADISALEAELKKYSAETLEYKALKQEISRLKAGSLRETRQQSGALPKDPAI